MGNSVSWVTLCALCQEIQTEIRQNPDRIHMLGRHSGGILDGPIY